MAIDQNQTAVRRFDRWSRTYDRGHLKTWLRAAQHGVLAGAGVGRDDRLLDVGCGTGAAVIAAARRPVDAACGIDVSPGMIERAWQNAAGLPNVEFRVADAEAIPYPDETFTAVICTNSFHHYSDPLRALAEIRRVLRPHGRLVIVDPDRSRCLWIWCWDRVLRVVERSHVRYYTTAEIVALLGAAGFIRVRLLAAEHAHLRRGKIAWASSMVRGDTGDRQGERP